MVVFTAMQCHGDKHTCVKNPDKWMLRIPQWVGSGRRPKLCFAKGKMGMWKAAYLWTCHVLLLSLLTPITNLLWARAAGLGTHLVCLSDCCLSLRVGLQQTEVRIYCPLHGTVWELKNSSSCWHDAETDPKAPTSRIAGSCCLWVA